MDAVPCSAHGNPDHRGEARGVLGGTAPGWLAWVELGRRVRCSGVTLLFVVLSLGPGAV